MHRSSIMRASDAASPFSVEPALQIFVTTERMLPLARAAEDVSGLLCQGTNGSSGSNVPSSGCLTSNVPNRAPRDCGNSSRCVLA